MNFNKIALERYSVRGFTDQAVEEEKLLKILEAAQYAPSATNRQPYKIYVIKTEDNKENLRKIYNKDWFVNAPLVICVCCIPAEAWVRSSDQENYSQVDAAIVMDHIILAATDLSLGTCWIAAFDPVEAKNFLGLPDNQVPLLLTPLGYPNKEPVPKKRKSLEDLVVYID